jgi:hypothetical protein
MEPISHKIQIGKGMYLTAAFFMAMPPMQISFHKEKDYDAKNKIREYRLAFIVFQAFRKDMQKGASDERACGEANQAKKDFMQQVILNGKGKNTHQGYKAD